jgi:hypothetical protein
MPRSNIRAIITTSPLSGCRKTSRTWRRNSGRSSRQSTTWCACDTSIVGWARPRRAAPHATRSPVGTAPGGIRLVSPASGRGSAGRRGALPGGHPCHRSDAGAGVIFRPPLSGGVGCHLERRPIGSACAQARGGHAHLPRGTGCLRVMTRGGRATTPPTRPSRGPPPSCRAARVSWLPPMVGLAPARQHRPSGRRGSPAEISLARERSDAL